MAYVILRSESQKDGVSYSIVTKAQAEKNINGPWGSCFKIIDDCTYWINYIVREETSKVNNAPVLLKALKETRSKLINAYGLFGGGIAMNEIFDFLNKQIEAAEKFNNGRGLTKFKKYQMKKIKEAFFKFCLSPCYTLI